MLFMIASMLSWCGCLLCICKYYEEPRHQAIPELTICLNTNSETYYEEPRHQAIPELTISLNTNSETYYEENGTQECIICLEPYEDEEIRVLYCFHSFHKKCIDKWIHCSQKKKCPICNITLDS